MAWFFVFFSVDFLLFFYLSIKYDNNNLIDIINNELKHYRYFDFEIISLRKI